MTTKDTRPGPRPDHRPRNVQPKQHDPYQRRAKRKAAFVCEQCSVVQHGGKWFWGEPPLTDVETGLCPACRRTRDRYPAGTIRLRGEFAPLEVELRNLIANLEAAEKEEHPLERLMEVESSEGELVVTTTGVHLARRIVNSLERRLHRQARQRYGDGEQRLVAELTV